MKIERKKICLTKTIYSTTIVMTEIRGYFCFHLAKFYFQNPVDCRCLMSIFGKFSACSANQTTSVSASKSLLSKYSWVLSFNEFYQQIIKTIYLPNPSPQSLSPSHLKEFGMQRPVEHLKSEGEQVGVVQFCWFSSELSRQSSSPSHTHVLGMHLWLSQVKSQEFGQACKK